MPYFFAAGHRAFLKPFSIARMGKARIRHRHDNATGDSRVMTGLICTVYLATPEVRTVNRQPEKSVARHADKLAVNNRHRRGSCTLIACSTRLWSMP